MFLKRASFLCSVANSLFLLTIIDNFNLNNLAAYSDFLTNADLSHLSMEINRQIKVGNTDSFLCYAVVHLKRKRRSLEALKRRGAAACSKIWNTKIVEGLKFTSMISAMRPFL